jgi:hypothetical protein
MSNARSPRALVSMTLGMITLQFLLSGDVARPYGYGRIVRPRVPTHPSSF